MRHTVVKTIPAHLAVQANLQAHSPTVSLIHIRSNEKQPSFFSTSSLCMLEFKHRFYI